MRNACTISAALLIAAGCLPIRPGTSTAPRFERIQLSDLFYAEGVAIGDLNRDGVADVAAGPYWYEGPDYRDRHAFYPPQPFDPLKYSDNFVVEVHDVNADGWNDILIVGFPGKEAFWYENGKGAEGHWTRHLIFDGVDNESPAITDITGDGRPEIVFHHKGTIGYAAADPERPTEPWGFHAISVKTDLGTYTHGFGVGDVNGDGRRDIIMADGWWENPGAGPSADAGGSSETGPNQSAAWMHHPADFGPGGAQMYAYDVDGDGMSDVITSLQAHGWGLAWFRQVRDGDDIRFEKNLIMGERIEDNPYGVRFSQPHALALVDVDRDGLQDIVTGKRYWAHGPTGDPEPNAPAVLYWFRLVRSGDGGATFVPELIDDDSGVGVSIAAGDLTGNGYPDIVVSNKKGTFVFRQHP